MYALYRALRLEHAVLAVAVAGAHAFTLPEIACRHDIRRVDTGTRVDNISVSVDRHLRVDTLRGRVDMARRSHRSPSHSFAHSSAGSAAAA